MKLSLSTNLKRIKIYSSELDKIATRLAKEILPAQKYVKQIFGISEKQRRKRSSRNIIYKSDIKKLQLINEKITLGTFNILHYISKREEYKNYKSKIIEFKMNNITNEKTNKRLTFTPALLEYKRDIKYLPLPQLLLALSDPEINSPRDREELQIFHKQISKKFGWNSKEAETYLDIIRFKNSGYTKFEDLYSGNLTLKKYQSLVKQYGSIEKLRSAFHELR